MVATTKTRPLAKTQRDQRAECRRAPPAIRKPTFQVRALYIGEHIDLRGFIQSKRIPATAPAVVSIPGGGMVLLYRYGAAVFFDVSPSEQQRFLDDIKPLITQEYDHPEAEELRVSITSEKPEGEIGEAVILKDSSLERLQTVAAVLSKSVALAQYEADVAINFELIEPFAVQLEQSGRGGHNMRYCCSTSAGDYSTN